ncbi:hypothetical protein ACFFGH_32395 [Lysobacter korlensis]|uniref:Lycopene cyclase domain-containing protein n=1 Tax=Lysobacter korlensis TaxID=553636 RepID=A0ABV6RZZ8_9GAMM
MDPEIILSVVGLASLLLVMVGCWTLHRRLRTRATTGLIVSVVGLLAWLPLSQIVEYLVMRQVSLGRDSSAWNWILVVTDLFAPIVLLFGASLSFWLAVRSVEPRPRPNNSSKPTPLRGAA